MNCLFILLSTALAVCSATDSGLYVNKIPLKSRYGAYNEYTYMTSAYSRPIQATFENEGPSIGALYEDDSSSDAATCESDACPKLTRLYLFLDDYNGTLTYERIVDPTLKSSLGDAVPIGYVAPYPGYCSSDDALPIIELYTTAMSRPMFLYWTPANPSQYVDVNGTTLDKTRFVPIRLVGYALSQSPATLTLENSSPDYAKTVAKGNYKHSFYPMQEVVEAVKNGKHGFAATPEDVDTLVGSDGYSFSGSLGFFSLAKTSAGNSAKLDEVCGSRVGIYSFVNTTDTAAMRVYLRTDNSVATKAGFKPRRNMGEVFTDNKAVCGGIKGLSKVVELQHKTEASRYTYAVDPAKISALTSSGEWTVVANRNLGYLPLDVTGFLLINQQIDYPYQFASTS